MHYKITDDKIETLAQTYWAVADVCLKKGKNSLSTEFS